VAPVVKELEKELGALLPERWAQKVAEHGSAVREWSLRPLGDSLKLNLDDRNRTSTPSALPPLLRDLAEAKLGQAILAKSPLELALGVAGWLFLALCFSRCCCRRREPPHKRLVEPDEEEARGGMPSPRPKRRSDAELAEQVAELKLRMKEVGGLVLRSCASPVPLLCSLQTAAAESAAAEAPPDAFHRPCLNEAEQELAEQVAELKLRMKEVGELERRLAVSKATRPEVASLVQVAQAARSERESREAQDEAYRAADQLRAELQSAIAAASVRTNGSHQC